MSSMQQGFKFVRNLLLARLLVTVGPTNTVQPVNAFPTANARRIWTASTRRIAIHYLHVLVSSAAKATRNVVSNVVPAFAHLAATK